MAQTKKQKHPGPTVLGVADPELGPDDVHRTAHPLTDGVVLLTRDFESYVQLTALTQAIRAIRSDVLIYVNHEGGYTQRAKADGFTHLSTISTLSKLRNTDALVTTRAATTCCYVLATELRTYDIDFDFTSALDLNHDSSGVVNDRVFRHGPCVITVLANHLTLGLRLTGVSNYDEHFPGCSCVQADLYVVAPMDERPLEAAPADDV